MKVLRLLACLAALAATSACATIIRGTAQDFTVNSEPDGARAVLSTGEVCEATPCTFRRSRNEAFTVVVSRPGYVTEEHQIRNPWSGKGATTGMVGNAILGGAIGVGIDAATGANRDLTPNPLMVTLTPEPVAAPVAAEPAEAAPAEALSLEPQEAAPASGDAPG